MKGKIGPIITEQLASIYWLRTPSFDKKIFKHGWQSYVTYVDPKSSPITRNDLMEYLQQHGISTRPGTHAVHMLGFYANKYQLKPQHYPGAQAANDHSMSIPLHNRMSKEDYEYVVRILKSVK